MADEHKFPDEPLRRMLADTALAVLDKVWKEDVSVADIARVMMENGRLVMAESTRIVAQADLNNAGREMRKLLTLPYTAPYGPTFLIGTDSIRDPYSDRT